MESKIQQTAGEWAIDKEATGTITGDIDRDHSHIKGWGIDANPDDHPNYPMKHWNGDDHKRLSYERPTQQPLTVEKLHSNERPSVSAVFGTSVPPSGLSGKLRRYAFRFSEGNWTHWLTLILADRVNMIEGIVDDIREGHVPNFIVERGWTAEWKYNRVNFLKNVGIGAAVIGGLCVMLSGSRKLRRAL
jgi:hypothetical protein